MTFTTHNSRFTTHDSRLDYFEFYNFPRSFQVDEKVLRQLYLEHSRKYHPDFHTLSGEVEQARVLDLSTQNNEAFKTLSDPDKRIQYVSGFTARRYMLREKM